LIVNEFTEMKLYTIPSSREFFFLGGNFIRYPYRLLRRIIIPVSLSLGKILFINSRSSDIYLKRLILIDRIYGSRLIKYLIKFVSLISLIVLVK